MQQSWSAYAINDNGDWFDQLLGGDSRFGSYAIKVPPGTYNVGFRGGGYAPGFYSAGGFVWTQPEARTSACHPPQSPLTLSSSSPPLHVAES